MHNADLELPFKFIHRASCTSDVDLELHSFGNCRASTVHVASYACKTSSTHKIGRRRILDHVSLPDIS